MRLSQIETSGTNEVAYVFDEKERAGLGREIIYRMAHHVRVQMAAFAGIDLHRRRARGTDAVGIVGGLLVAFNDGAGRVAQHL